MAGWEVRRSIEWWTKGICSTSEIEISGWIWLAAACGVEGVPRFHIRGSVIGRDWSPGR